MTRVAHLLRNDLRHARWLIAVWLTLVLTDFIIRLLDSGLASSESHGVYFLSGWLLFLPTLLVAVLFTSRIVHADPVFDTRAFWLTRPIGRSALHASKLLLLLIVLVLPGLLAFALFLVAWRVADREIVVACAEILMLSLVGTVVLFTAATFTDRLWQMLLFLAGLAIVVPTLILVCPVLYRRVLPAGTISGLQVAGTFTVVPIVGFLATAVGGALTTWQMYRRRRRLIAMAQLAGLVGALALLPPVFALSMPTPPAWTEPATTEPWALSLRTVARIRPEAVRASTFNPSGNVLVSDPSSLWAEFTAPVVLDGLPEGHVAAVSLRDIEWRVDDHRSFDRAGYGLSKQHRPSGPFSARPDEHWVTPSWPMNAPARESSLVLLRLPAKTSQRYRARPGHYSATATFDIYRYDPLGSQPLRVGTAVTGEGRQRVEIVRTRNEDGPCTFDMRWLDIEQLFEIPWPESTLGYRLEGASGARLEPQLIGGERWYDSTASVLPFTPSTSPSPVRLHYQSVLTRETGNSPARAGGPSARPIPCAEVRWATARITRLGTITRRIDIPNLVLPAWEPATDAALPGSARVSR